MSTTPVSGFDNIDHAAVASKTNLRLPGEGGFSSILLAAEYSDTMIGYDYFRSLRFTQ